MDESIKKALENSLVSKSQIEKKILPLFESINSKEEEDECWDKALNILMEEHGYEVNDAIDFVRDILEKKHIELPSEKGGCLSTMLILLISTLSLYFIL